MNDFTATQPICHFHHTINTWYIQGIGWTCSYCRQDGIEYKVLTKNEARKILFDPPVVEKDPTHWCANKNCDGPFIPTTLPTDNFCQLYCSPRCKRAEKAHRRAERERALNELKGETPHEVIVDEMIHIWGVDYDNPETQKIVTEPKSFHEFGPSVDVVTYAKDDFTSTNLMLTYLKERIAQPMQLKAEVHDRIRKMAEDDVAMILEFGMQYTDIKFEAYQLVFIYNYFYKMHRKEALGE